MTMASYKAAHLTASMAEYMSCAEQLSGIAHVHELTHSKITPWRPSCLELVRSNPGHGLGHSHAGITKAGSTNVSSASQPGLGSL